MEIDKYMLIYKEVWAKKIAWVELNVRIYNFFMKHSPPDLDSVFKANSIWFKIMTDQDGIWLINVIRYITQKQDEKM